MADSVSPNLNNENNASSDGLGFQGSPDFRGLVWEPVTLVLKQAFEVAHGRSTHRRSMLVGWRENGVTGWGEAPEILYANARIETMQSALAKASEAITACMQSGGADGRPVARPDTRWHALKTLLENAGAGPALMPLLNALDQAGWDHFAQSQSMTTWQAMGLPDPDGAVSCFTLGMDAVDVLVQKLAGNFGWPAYKIKLGSQDVEQDWRCLQALDAWHALMATREPACREAGAVKVQWRVDANTGWTPEQTIAMAKRMLAAGAADGDSGDGFVNASSINVSFIEQPTPPAMDDQLKDWIGDCPLPLMADESCQTQADVRRCHEAGYQAVNIKPAKCGGLTPARAMLQEARALGMQAMLGCMVESVVGISAIGQLVGLADFADVDGATLIEPTGWDGLQLALGRLRFPDRLGSGAVPVA